MERVLNPRDIVERLTDAIAAAAASPRGELMRRAAAIQQMDTLTPRELDASLRQAGSEQLEIENQYAAASQQLVDVEAELAQLVRQADSIADCLRRGCQVRIASMVANDTSDTEWIQWLRDWHLQNQYAWAPPTQDAASILLERGVIDDAEFLWRSLIEDQGEVGAPPVERTAASMTQLTAQSALLRHESAVLASELAPLAAIVGDALRVVRDLPVLDRAYSLEELQGIHQILSHMHALLGRYAASAEAETHALERI
jgi:hypothetical protein